MIQQFGLVGWLIGQIEDGNHPASRQVSVFLQLLGLFGFCPFFFFFNLFLTIFLPILFIMLRNVSVSLKFPHYKFSILSTAINCSNRSIFVLLLLYIWGLQPYLYLFLNQHCFVLLRQYYMQDLHRGKDCCDFFFERIYPFFAADFLIFEGSS